MKIFGIDTSGRIASVALCVDGVLKDTIIKNTNLSHSEAVLPICEELLANNGLKLCDIDAFAVVVGPGSFTGLRIGIAAAKGFAYTLEKPLIGISALECSALASGKTGVVCPLIKARENDYFYGLYLCDNNTVKRKAEDSSNNIDSIYKSYDDGSVSFYNGEYGAKEAAVLAYKHLNEGYSTDVHNVNPVYLKLSQAERMHKSKI